MRLSLSGNPIRRLSRTSLTGLRGLTSLELSRCELETVEEDAFAAQTKLQWLRLDGNRLFTMQPDGLSLGLHGVDLHANTWRTRKRQQRPPAEADAKTEVISTAVDTPSSTCSAPKCNICVWKGGSAEEMFKDGGAGSLILWLDDTSQELRSPVDPTAHHQRFCG
ncbi:Slit 2 protein [Amphibalanus amphitrite]|uniref:Slit 2 protein n=1 Tax=Amphibalanus amphitrite TaxID=1232801 RepID=A0A6A4VQM5_AMPAM|nr:Slit 2 protein [Amphibalanus amphitrite]